MKIVAVALCGLAVSFGAAALVARSDAADGNWVPTRARTGPPGALFEVMVATARFNDPNEAIAAGYVPNSPCISDPTYGGMGIHFENFALMADPAIIPTKPEILVYHPTADGGLRLGAVEYWQRDADQNLATAEDRPSLFGQPFNGPMPGHSPVMPVHYDLHVWLWRANPNGLFFPYNSDVSC